MEVLLAEILFDGSIIQMPPEDIAALLSCFVCESGMTGRIVQDLTHLLPQALTSQSDSRLVLLTEEELVAKFSNPQVPPEELVKIPSTVPEHLQSTVRSMFVKAQQLENIQRKFGVLDGESDVRLNAILVGPVHAWASNQPFSAVVAINHGEVSEGHMLRSLQRLDELLRHVCAACRGLGDQALALRMEAARAAVHRDMVCAPSLYVADEIAEEQGSSSSDSKEEGEEQEVVGNNEDEDRESGAEDGLETKEGSDGGGGDEGEEEDVI